MIPFAFLPGITESWLILSSHFVTGRKVVSSPKPFEPGSSDLTSAIPETKTNFIQVKWKYWSPWKYLSMSKWVLQMGLRLWFHSFIISFIPLQIKSLIRQFPERTHSQGEKLVLYLVWMQNFIPEFSRLPPFTVSSIWNYPSDTMDATNTMVQCQPLLIVKFQEGP